MSLISLRFVIFFAVVLAVYYLIPARHQWKVLLAASLLFYVLANPVYIVFILISIVSTWALMRDPKRSHFIITIVINLGLLIFFRYSVYLGVRSLAVPLGISFYTFMTLGYAHDCYGKKIQPSSDLLKYALFISYFPQITEGPIGTYQKMMDRLTAEHKYELSNIKEGGYRVIKGVFKKLVIAGRLNYYVDTVFSAPDSQGGLTLLIGVFFYAIELYADFSGYMDIACGISRMLGIELAENFIRPYFSRDIQEYWRRWHITLNEWFKEHLMLPAVTSSWNRKAAKGLGRIFPKAKKGNLRTVFPLILVWIITGIWHGAEAVYIGWGVYFAIIMMISVLSMGQVKKLKKKIGWNDENRGIIVFKTLRTFFIVLMGEVMFRAESLKDAFLIYRKIFTDTRIGAASVASALTPFGNGNQALASVLILIVLIGGLFVVEWRKECDPNAFTKHRYLYAGAMMVATVLFGVLGASRFMYQAF
ncbi:MAG: MBOAT family protein [Lachnospiraceae bacterium]|nr:MBOAT family protein [Lachnospiraceae bacterium]